MKTIRCGILVWGVGAGGVAQVEKQETMKVREEKWETG